MVLAALTAHLAGVGERLRAAELAQAKAEARAAGERKRRVLTLALAASIFATGLLGAGGWYWAARQRAAGEEATSLEVNRAIDDANRKRNRARLADGDASTHWIEAVEAARRAESLLTRVEGNPELRGRVRSTLESIMRDRDESESSEKDHRIIERLAEIHNDLGEHGDDQRADVPSTPRRFADTAWISINSPRGGGGSSRRKPGRGRGGQRGSGPMDLQPPGAASLHDAAGAQRTGRGRQVGRSRPLGARAGFATHPRSQEPGSGPGARGTGTARRHGRPESAAGGERDAPGLRAGDAGTAGSGHHDAQASPAVAPR